MQTAVPCWQLHGWLTYTSANRVGSLMLPRGVAGPAALSVALGDRQGQFFCQLSHLPYALAGWGGCQFSNLKALFILYLAILPSSWKAVVIHEVLPLTHFCQHIPASLSPSWYPLWGRLQMHCLTWILHDLLLHFKAHAAMSVELISPPPPFFFSYYFSLLCLLLSLCFLPVIAAAAKWKSIRCKMYKWTLISISNYVITKMWDIIFISFITISNNANLRKWDQITTKSILLQ